ncbi:MAG: 30S ribosomal protein S20 [Verrucomicrobiae bacterium]|nr:30S ribosomal protein S20 [Verrucomicrobiae bacterium]
MPKKTTSSARRVRSDACKRARNQAAKARVRTGFRALLKQAKADPQRVAERARQVVSWVDRAVKTGVLHRNAGNRLKARAMALIARR